MQLIVELGGTEELVGTEEAGEADEGQTEDAQEGDFFFEILVGVAELDQTADDKTQHLGLFFEAGKLVILPVGAVTARQLAGVKAMFEGVCVAGLATPAARCGCVGHRDHP